MDQKNEPDVASGLVKLFVCHLRATEKQFDKGGYSIIIEVPTGHKRLWFTKGTVLRWAELFVSRSVDVDSYFFNFHEDFLVSRLDLYPYDS